MKSSVHGHLTEFLKKGAELLLSVWNKWGTLYSGSSSTVGSRWPKSTCFRRQSSRVHPRMKVDKRPELQNLKYSRVSKIWSSPGFG